MQRSKCPSASGNAAAASAATPSARCSCPARPFALSEPYSCQVVRSPEGTGRVHHGAGSATGERLALLPLTQPEQDLPGVVREAAVTHERIARSGRRPARELAPDERQIADPLREGAAQEGGEEHYRVVESVSHMPGQRMKSGSLYGMCGFKTGCFSRSAGYSRAPRARRSRSALQSAQSACESVSMKPGATIKPAPSSMTRPWRPASFRVSTTAIRPPRIPRPARNRRRPCRR